MKITPADIQPTGAAAAGERKTSSVQSGPTGASEPVSAAEPSATVRLSGQVALDSESGRADFDTAKVERIAQAIRDGNFRVNADVIADRLIANAKELLPKAQH